MSLPPVVPDTFPPPPSHGRANDNPNAGGRLRLPPIGPKITFKQPRRNSALGLLPSGGGGGSTEATPEPQANPHGPLPSPSLPPPIPGHGDGSSEAAPTQPTPSDQAQPTLEVLAPAPPSPPTSPLASVEAMQQALAEQRLAITMMTLENELAANESILAQAHARHAESKAITARAEAMTAKAEASIRASLVEIEEASPLRSPSASPATVPPPAGVPALQHSPPSPSSPSPGEAEREPAASPTNRVLRATLSLLPTIPAGTSVAITSTPFPKEKKLAGTTVEQLRQWSRDIREHCATNPTAAQALHPAQLIVPGGLVYSQLAKRLGLEGPALLSPNHVPLSAEEFLTAVEALSRPKEGAFETSAYALLAMHNNRGAQNTRATAILSSEFYANKEKREPFFATLANTFNELYFQWVNDPAAMEVINPASLVLDLLPTSGASRWLLAAHLFTLDPLKPLFKSPPSPCAWRRPRVFRTDYGGFRGTWRSPTSS